MSIKSEKSFPPGNSPIFPRPKLFQAFSILLLGGSIGLCADGNIIDGPDADLIYDYRTGNVVLDAAGIGGTFIVIADSVTNPTTNLFRVENLTLPFEDPLANTEVGTGLIGYSGSRGFADFARADLGDILPIGVMSPTELRNFFGSSSGYAVFLPSRRGDFDLIVVPEPSSCWLLGMGLLLVCRRWRRIVDGHWFSQRTLTRQRPSLVFSQICKQRRDSHQRLPPLAIQASIDP